MLPFLVALFASILSLPLLFGLQRRGVPRTLAITLTILLATSLLVGGGFLLGGAVTEFAKRVPDYQEGLQTVTARAVDWLQSRGYAMEAADLFVLPSRSEGQPNALIEAMAMGLPIVATRVGGVPELAAEGEEALLVPPESPPALAAACKLVLTSPELGQRLGAAARDRARRTHDAAVMARQYQRLYTDILRGDTA